MEQEEDKPASWRDLAWILFFLLVTIALVVLMIEKTVNS